MHTKDKAMIVLRPAAILPSVACTGWGLDYDRAGGMRWGGRFPLMVAGSGAVS